MSCRSSFAVVFCLLLLQGGSASGAGAQGSIAVLRVDMAGDAPPELREQLSRSLERGLALAGFDVVGRRHVEGRLGGKPELVGCYTTTCLERIAPLVGAKRFVRARVEAEGAAYTIELELLSSSVDGGVVHRVEVECGVCTIAEANELMSKAAAQLVEPPSRGSETSPEPPSPESPSSATPAAPSPAPPPVPPSPSSAPPPTRPYRIWKWVAAGGAATLLVSGATLVVIDGECTQEPIPPRSCPELWDTLSWGVTATAAGVILGGLSTVMFLQDHQAAQTPHTALVPLRGGVAFSVALTF